MLFRVVGFVVVAVVVFVAAAVVTWELVAKIESVVIRAGSHNTGVEERLRKKTKKITRTHWSVCKKSVFIKFTFLPLKKKRISFPS